MNDMHAGQRRVPVPGLRAAIDDDAGAIALVWHRAWPDGHRGHVPHALYEFRTFEHFQERVRPRISQTTVATIGNSVVGFVTVVRDQVEQLFVDAEVRGSPCALMLLQSAEHTIGQSFSRAWLAVAGGNARARRFYARQNWLDIGEMTYSADVCGGVLSVPVRRYEKQLANQTTAIRRPRA